MRERQHYKDDSRKADEQVYHLITIVFLPFLALVGYALFDKRFAPLLLTVPIFSILGLFIISTIFLRYKINGLYSAYLENKINDILGSKIIIGEDVCRIYYAKGLTIINAGIAVILMFPLLLTGCLVPTINRTLIQPYIQKHMVISVTASTYWSAVCCLALLLVLVVIHQYNAKANECKMLLQSNGQDQNSNRINVTVHNQVDKEGEKIDHTNQSTQQGHGA